LFSINFFAESGVHQNLFWKVGCFGGKSDIFAEFEGIQNNFVLNKILNRKDEEIR
jgi:hypothetical protein